MFDVRRPDGARRPRGSALIAMRVLLIRFRFFFLLAAVLLLVAIWPAIRSHWQQFARQGKGAGGALSVNMEYWCPMCPGVVSDFPGKCPVCNMALIRRDKGEPAPLPEGVVARMQFSPYRVQLAGIRTMAVDYRQLRRLVEMVGTVARDDSSVVFVDAEVYEKDLPFLFPGQSVQVASDLLPGHLSFGGEVALIEGRPRPGSRSFHVRLKIKDPDMDLRHGTLVTARAEAPITRLPWLRRARMEEWRDRTAIELAAQSLLAPTGPLGPRGLQSLIQGGLREALGAEGIGLAVPVDSVIDHGSWKLAFVENGPGMFDAVEVTVGPRCNGFYPVLRGIEAGQQVAVSGAFLLDAEMWLNHGVAATYFGSTRNAARESTPPSPSTHQQEFPSRPGVSEGVLSDSDRTLAARQKVCPVTGQPLDSMGGPVRLEVAGRIVFICCKGCEGTLRKDPGKYLSKIPAK
jgi:Cu(I)/Ag(I) efflux system membrane fusion protein